MCFQASDFTESKNFRKYEAIYYTSYQLRKLNYAK